MFRFIFLIILLSAFACSKTKSDDKTPPTVTITAPIHGEVVSGTSIFIEGNITDENRIVEVHVHIYNKDSGALLVDIHRNPGSNTYVVNENFSTNSGTTYRLQLIAKDNSGNEGRDTIEFTAF